MSATTIKQWDTMQAIARQILLFNTPLDMSADTWRILTSGADSVVPDVPLYFERDVTLPAKVNGDPVNGVLGLPIFTGATVAGVRTAPVTVGASEEVAITFPASTNPLCTAQRIYATKADDPGGILYFCAEGANGFAVAGSPVNNPDASLLAPSPVADESATNSGASLGVPGAITSAVPGAAVTLSMTPGDHEFAIVEVSSPDSSAVRVILFEVIVEDLLTLRRFTFPQVGFEELHVVENVE